MSSVDATDLALLDRWREQHDAEAFAELLRRHSAMVFGASRRILRNEADAQEVAQECFLALLRDAASGGHIRKSLGGWLHAAAVSLSLDRLKAERRRTRREETFAGASAPDPAAHDLDEIQRYVDEAIHQLPDDLKSVLIAHFLEGQSHQAVADQLGLPRTTVTSRIARGIDEVRKTLRRRGIILSVSALASLLTAEAAQAAPAVVTATLSKIALAEGAAVAGTAPMNAGGVATLSAMGGLVMLKTGAAVGIGIALLVGLALLLYPDVLLSPAQNSSVQPTAVRPARPASTPDTQIRALAELPEAFQVAVGAAETPGVRGRVVDTSGNPIADATVRLLSASGEKPAATTTTDAEGLFAFNSASPPGEARLLASKEGMVSMPGQAPEVDASRDGFTTLLLYRAASVEGRVVDASGAPLPGQEVTARWLEKPYLTESEVADSTSNFSITGLLPGSHALAAAPANRAGLEDLRVDLAEGENKTGLLLVVNDLLYSVAGFVTNEAGDAVEGADIQMNLSIENSPSTKSDKDGHFILPRLPSGAYQMFASHPDYEFQLLRDVETGRSDVAIVLLSRDVPDGGVSGRVIAARTHLPITDFSIGIRNGIWRGPTLGDREGAPFHDPAGRFTIENLEARDTTLVATAEGYAPGYEPVHVVDGQPTPEVVIALEQGLILKGTVVTEAGTPVADAFVFNGDMRAMKHYEDVENYAFNMKQFGVPQTDADGAFTIIGLTPGEPLTLLAHHPNYGYGRVDVVPSTEREESVVITLHSGGGIEGVVTMGGQPVEGARVSEYGDDYHENFADSEADSGGVYALTGLPDGSHTIFVRIDGSVPPGGYRVAYRYGVQIANGQTTRLDFNYPPGNSTLMGLVTVFGKPPLEGSARLRMKTSVGEELSDTPIRTGGNYMFDEIPGGAATLFITVKMPNGEWTAKSYPINIPEGQSAGFDIDIGGSGGISGIVTGMDPYERGQVLAIPGEARVAALDQSVYMELRGYSQGQSEMGYDGRFAIKNLEPGVYTIVAIVAPGGFHGWDLDEARASSCVVEVSENGVLDLDLDVRK